MNTAVAMRQHYDDVKKRLRTDKKSYVVVSREIIHPTKPAPPAPEPKPMTVLPTKMPKTKGPNPFAELDESLKAALRWAPKDRMIEIIKDTGYTLDDLRSAARDRPLVHLRWELYWVLLHEFGWSRSRIGKYFNKDHTTVLHGIKQIEKREKEKTNVNSSND